MMTVNQIQSDGGKMKKFICERIPPEGTRIFLPDLSGAESGVDLIPIWEENEWDLLIESDDRCGLRDVYEHFRRQEMTCREWEREMAGEINRWKVRDLEREKVPVKRLKVSGVGDLLTPEQLMARWEIDECHYQELIGKGLPSLPFEDGITRHPEVAVDDWLRRFFGPSDLLTEEEAIRRLRLDTIKISNPADTLRRYRDKGLLRATQVSKRLFYRASELDSFLTIITETNPR